ncbi:6-phosphogluconolactonase [Candidatus Paraburkholderia calva]|nr:6-phosphogluconolactonase [Candidatus Paraburkholderia calva]
MTQIYSVFVSNAADGEIGAYRLDAASGTLAPETCYRAGANVMPLAWSPDGATLYAATRGEPPGIVTFAFDAEAGTLTRLHAAPIESNLAYLSADASGRYLLGASYGEHRASLYDATRIAQGGGATLQFADGIEHAHSAVSSRDGRHMYVASLGADTIHCFDLRDGALHALDVVPVEGKFGPRHMRFSPDEATLYVVSEFRATVAAFALDPHTGKLGAMKLSEPAPALSHLKPGRARPSFASGKRNDPAELATLIWGADIQVTPDGRFVYVSERTSSRLIAFRVQDDGALAYAGFTDTETQPRGFRIDVTGRFLAACGEKSTHVSAYSIDAETGALTLLSRCEGGKGGNWVEIVARA